MIIGIKGMRYFLVLFILAGLSVKNIAQDIDYERIVKYVNQTPNSVVNSTFKLSNYLTLPFNTDIEKLASIYYWVAKNIRYDDKLAKNPKLYIETKEVVDDVMKSKSGVCQHYAVLFAELSRLAGLKAYVVEGYTMDKGKIADVSHAWNLVNVSGDWSFVDATWANAIIKSKTKKGFPQTYFMVKPEENIKTHMPFDPIWQILSSPIKYDEFDAGKFNLVSGNFSYNDSIGEYLMMSSIGQYRATIGRMQNNGTFNKLIKKEFEIKQKNLSTSLSNEEILKYNKGIVYYNIGMNFLNQYIKLKNNKFKDKKYGKSALMAIIDSSSVNLQKAESNFAEIQINDPEIKRQIKTNTTNINKSKTMIVKEQEYIKQFFQVIRK